MENPSQLEGFQQETEKVLQRYLCQHTPIKFFPVLESKENLWYFIGWLCNLMAVKATEEFPEDARQGRPDASLIRAISWAGDLIWDDLFQHPMEPLMERTIRLTTAIKRASALPPKKKETPDPRRVAWEYEMLIEKLKPAFKRRPARGSIKRLPGYREATFGGERVDSFLKSLLIIKNQERQKAWAIDQLRIADKEMPIPWWSRERYFSFGDKELIQTEPKLTAHKAALKVLAYFMDMGEEMVWKYVKEGRTMLPSNTTKVLVDAWKNRQHDPAACEFIHCIHPRS